MPHLSLRAIAPLFPLLMASPALAASATAPPPLGSLAFGNPPALEARTLGQPKATDDEGETVWRDYQIPHATVRIGYDHDRATNILVMPETPLTWPQASGWAHAFVPGFDRARLVREDPTRWVAFSTLVIRGGLFESQLRFDRQGDRVTQLSGEVHWMD